MSTDSDFNAQAVARCRKRIAALAAQNAKKQRPVAAPVPDEAPAPPGATVIELAQWRENYG